MALGNAVTAIHQMQQRIRMPSAVHGSFSGTAEAFQASLAGEPFLILAALIAVYIVLGILYESYIHPITILSTLPSASVGALLALMLFHTELSVIAIIGLLLLIGIVKKNAILMVDFALEAGARRKHATTRSDISSVPAQVPTNPYDHNGSFVWRITFDHVVGYGRGTAPAIGHRHCWWLDPQSSAHAVHDARGILVF